METITFYSYKGGVGRTLALAHIANYLSRLGQKVCILDFDLEAPGLHYKFPEITKPPIKGLIDCIYHFSMSKSVPYSISDYVIPLSKSSDAGEIMLFPAGDETSSNYWKKLSSINWQQLFYEPKLLFCWNEIPGIDSEKLIEFLQKDYNIKVKEIEKSYDNMSINLITEDKSPFLLELNEYKTIATFKIKDEKIDDFIVDMDKGKINIYKDISEGVFFFLELKEMIKAELKPDFLLIDSRTGITEMGGITTSLLPDKVVFLLANNRENIEGARQIYHSITKDKRLDGLEKIEVTFALTRIPATNKDRENEILKNIETALNSGDNLTEQVKIKDMRVLHSDRELELSETLRTTDEDIKNPKRLNYEYVNLISKIISDDVLINIEKTFKIEKSYVDDLTEFLVRMMNRLKSESLPSPQQDTGLETCLFTWDEIPGNENEKLINALKYKYNIDWLKNAKIEKIDNGNIIKIVAENKSLSLILNDEKTRVNLKIDNDRIYLFNWNEIPGIDNGKLIEFLRRYYNIDWVRSAIIEKFNDDNIIRISNKKEKESLLLSLNNEKTEVDLDIVNDGRKDKFITELTNGKLNIYYEKIIKLNAKIEDSILKIY